MNKTNKYLLILALFIGCLSVFSGTTPEAEDLIFEEVEVINLESDTTTSKFPVKKTQITNYEDLKSTHPIDLRDPSNIKSEVEYDLKNNTYLFKTKIGDQEWVTPFSLNSDEYFNYSGKEAMVNYFKIKNAEAFENGDKEEFSLKDIKLNIGPAERIFGPGGIQIKPQGYAEVSMGINRTSTNAPTWPLRNRTRTMFDFKEKIQFNVNASVGDKLSFDLNYDTEATFDFDSKKIKLAYEGKEDEIIKYLEAGNVNLNTTNSLINGSSSLFGIRADLQFGKLRINTVISQQESEAKTVNSKGGVQTTPFEFKADQYDENRHFFLGNYFRNNYDEAMSKLPFIKSAATITNIEVWITNKRGNFDQARNFVAFADLGEFDVIKNKIWTQNGNRNNPRNDANNLYSEMVNNYADIRNISLVNSTLEQIPLESGQDYDKVESARLLSSSEYTFNPQLGYISLRSALQADEVLAVAYQYTMNGSTYQVGEFSAQIVDQFDQKNPRSGALILKLLKPVSHSPNSYTWDLMMKNIYSLGASQIQKDRFRLNISYLSDTTGTYINYIPEGSVKDTLLLRVMKLDRLDSRQNTRPDGIFDFVEGYTINSSTGRIIFPVIEPFGSHLRKMINDSIIADKYVYQELYDLTMTLASQVTEKNKFRMTGEYRATSGNEIYLNATNLVRGSVKVTAAGVVLQEGTQYTVDYMAGIVTITDQSILDSGTPVSATLENQTFFNMQRKVMLGLNLSYEFNKDINIGATIMHMYEKPLIMKPGVGNEAVKNTLWGLNAAYRTESQWLTNLIDKLPFVEATQPSRIALNAEFAQMLPGHYTNKFTGGYSYLDDFEAAKTRIDLHDPFAWSLASTPNGGVDGMFPEAILSNNIEYGKNRALLAWYRIDNIFTRRNSSLTPEHIKNDLNQLSNHYVREISIREIYPNRDLPFNEASNLPTLNLSFYPTQRGPYNLDAKNIEDDGSLKDPKTRWGGITRKLSSSSRDFEANNIEYIEFWLMDPYIYNDTLPENKKNKGGKLYINLGEISEDVLKDGRKFFENGLPITNDPSAVDTTVWGKVPRRQSTVYAFDASQGAEARKRQDVGLNGLSTEEERTFSTYKTYLKAFEEKTKDNIEILKNDPFSPINDPAGDLYHHFRGADYDRNQTSILDRYKYFNNTEGNSAVSENNETFSTAAQAVPDVEDIDQDYTMNENESYFQYEVDLDANKMSIADNNYIVDSRTVRVNLRNGNSEDVTWYQFKIPVRSDHKKRIGNIKDFRTIRFMRMFLTGFEKPTFLRFATLELVRGDWRVYTKELNDITDGVDEGTLNLAAVNIEENGDKEPVNYIIPPGVSRIPDPSQPQLIQENEQALSFQVVGLSPNAARAVHKNTAYDLRRYKRLQMFVHAEELIDKEKLTTGELTVFIRLGSDYRNNFYEYEIPLSITPPGRYSNNNPADQLIVWPKDNMFDFPLELLTNVKLNRNRKKRKGDPEVGFMKLYQEYDPEKVNNKVSILGNPSLADVKVLMIGVRNNSRHIKSGEVWVNELRVTDFDEEGGWAAQGNLNIALSDLGTINISGRKETAGFGAIDQTLLERRLDDFYMYNIATNVDLGRFLPEKAKISAPMYYAYSNQTTTPKYDPLDTDVSLKESLTLVDTKAERDSIKQLAQDRTTIKSFSLTNVKVNIQSKKPMPYDPANFSFGYAQNITETSNPTTVYDQTKDFKATLSYSYSPIATPWSPFKDIKSKAPMSRFARNLGFNYLPNNIAFNSFITRWYTETALRDLESYALGGNNKQHEFLTWGQNFYWDRDFSINWDFTKNLKATLQTGTRAEIEEPYRQVNRRLNPGGYEIWRDSVWQSIRNLGKPLAYKQLTRVTYTLPLNDIPFLDWINSAANYESGYRWDRGAQISDELEVGNSLSNDRTISLNNRMNMLNLYNKSPFLKKVNQKFDSNRRVTTQRPNNNTQKEKQAKKFEQDIQLKNDTTVKITHGLNTKNIRVTAKHDGKVYRLKYKKNDNNNITITTKDSLGLKINIVQGKDPEESTLYKIAEYSARGLMSLRTVTVNYSKRNETHINGFIPSVGDAFGQNRSDFGLTPGLGFAFGLEGGEDYMRKSIDRNWLVENEMNVNPAIFNSIERLDLRAQLEPFKGLRIDLTAIREKNDRMEMQFLGSDNITRVFGGSFTMSTIALSSALESSSAKDNYRSKTFDKFLSYRKTIASRLDDKYDGTPFPNKGFIKDIPNFDRPSYDPNIDGGFDENSIDVLIPAFLAAYTGQSSDKIPLSPFPALSAMLPNWNVTYDGLTTLPWFKEKFKSFRLSHSYNCQYRVGSYTSFSDWVDATDDFGFIRDVITGNPIPSSGNNISSVNIVEQFNPLFGADGTLNTGMTIRARYNSARTLSLNTSSFQIVEASQRELVMGMGYRISEFNRVIGLSAKNQKGFNNDLTLNADLSYKKLQSLIRKIQEQFTQATSGYSMLTIKLSADYALSRSLTLRGFFDKVINTPLVSATAYPTTNTNFGLSLRFTLSQ